MRTVAIVAFAAVIAAVAVAGAYPDLPEDTVQLDSGLIQGTVSDVVRAFRGVPYAAPPVGALRWQTTQAVASWDRIKATQEDGPGCIQHCTLPAGARACPLTTSEDCLTTTVFTPRLSNKPAAGWPVMVFFHGGNFHQGSGAGPIYNGTLFADQGNVVLVGVNYRLGAMGFFVADASTGISGNYGIRDQFFALQWVQRNIKAFGGDPNNVTIFGQSAGATSTLIHLTAPSIVAAKLFHRAIVMSSPVTLPLRDSTTMPALSKAFAQDVGCALTDAACLRGKSPDEILAAQLKTMTDLAADPKVILAFMPWEPYVDGTLITTQPFVALSAGAYDHSIPVIIGNVRQEAVVFIYSAYAKPLSPLGLAVVEDLILGLDGALKASAVYPVPAGTNDTRPIASTLGTDYIFLCSNRNVSRAMSQYSLVYNYVFDHVPSFNQTAWYPESECYTAVCHGVDLPFAFDSAQPYVAYDGVEEVLTRSMVAYFTSFARTGAPQPDPYSGMAWPAYVPLSSETMYFQTPANQVIDHFNTDFCDFWDTVGYGY